ncbi:hypothetical protein FBEOM_14649 [Fusarium beomiforme]|uniref:Uncharacterized protein n=1 Tax=Fusarium beomiforme TaxID=44412 RepID=A0A9P5A314_9HYPO|nr:hypothetical protein FBEOM_14649 [Fusarium beomiforme]
MDITGQLSKGGVAKDRDGNYLAHPLRFVRFPPKIGRNSELEKLGSLAVMIQWLPEGETNWKQYYLERQRLWKPMSEANPALKMYHFGLGILCDVEQVTYTDSPEWVLPMLPSKVNFLRYDHLQQKRVLEVVQARTLVWPDNYTMEHNKQRLIELFPPRENPNTVIGPRPASGFLLQNRKACDIQLHAIMIRMITPASAAGLYNSRAPGLEAKTSMIYLSMECGLAHQDNGRAPV